MNNPQNQGWRSGTAPKGARKKKRDWRHDKATGGSSGVRWSRIIKVGSGIGIIGLLTALLIALWLYFSGKQTTHVIALGPTSYSAMKPGLESEDAEQLVAQWTTANADDVQEFLSTPGGADFNLPDQTGRTTIVFVNAVVRPDEQGDSIKLLTGNTHPSDKFMGGQKLRDVIDTVKGARGRKLVLIDLSRVRYDWRLGLVAADFVSEIKAAADAKTVFLTSSDVGERSWAARQFGGRTAFAHFTREALHGKADADSNGYVTVKELAKYVQSKTADWVYRNRETSPGQHPRCFPPVSEISDDDDFTLVRVQSESKSLLSEGTNIDAELSQVSSRWAELQDMGPVWRKDPIAHRLVVKELRRAEEYLSLGRKSQTVKALESAKGHLERLRAATDVDSLLSQTDYFARTIVARRNANAAPDPDSKPEIASPESIVRGNLEWFGRRRESAGQAAPSTAQIVEAVELQKLAESVAAESLAVLPYFLDDLNRADVSRRAVHDALFTSTAGDADFDGAKAAYEAVREQARTAGHAEHVLFDALAALPYLAEFAAQDPEDGSVRTELMSFARDAENRDLFFAAGDEETPPFITGEPDAVCQRTAGLDTAFGSDNIPARVAALFAETRALRHQFAGAWNVNGMATLSARVEQRLAGLQKDLSDRAAELAGSSKEQPNALDRARLTQLLQFPMLAADVRTRLLRQRFSYESKMGPGGSAGKADADANPRAGMLRRGTWQMFWMLQVMALGEDASIGLGNTPLPVVRGRIQHREHIERWAALDESDGSYDPLVKMAFFGHQHYGRLVDQVKDDIVRARSATNLTERRRLLSRADYLTRFVHPSDAVLMQAMPRVPTPLLQTQQITEFALYYGNRSWLDFWRMPDTPPGERDWYQALIAECLGLAEEGTSFPEYSELQQRSAEPKLTLQDLIEVEFNRADQSKPLDVGVRESTVPAGQAAVWLQADGPLSIRIAANGLPVATASGSTRRFDLERDLAGGECHDGQLTADVFFRGHRRSAKLAVNPCSEPSSVVRLLPRPKTGEIKVEGKANRSIVFVLDWSQSMAADDSTRWEVAVKKLAAVIGQLDNNDEVALVLFGHRVYYNGEYSVKKDSAKLYGGAEPIGNSAAVYADFQTLAGLAKKQVAMTPSGKVKPQTLADWLNVLLTDPRYKPHGNTPMYGAIDSALDLLGTNGGAIVTITDGAATDFDRKLGMAERLRNANVSATVILFDFKGAESRKHIRAHGMSVLEAANNPDKLAKAINDAIPPRSYSATWKDDAFSKPALLGAKISDLLPSDYSVVFGKNARLDGLKVRGGELHLLRINQGQFERVRAHRGHLKVDAVAVESPGDPAHLDHTDFSIGPQQAEITVILDHNDLSRAVNWPAEIAFELTPAGGKPVKNLEVRFVAGQAVPTWKLLTPDWPKGNPNAKVSAFWKMEVTPVDRAIPWGALAGGNVRKVEASAGRLPDLTVEGVARGGEVTVTVKVDGPVPEGEVPLADLRVQLGRAVGGSFVPDVLPVRISRWPEGGMAEFVFTLPAQVPQNLQVGITSGRSLRDGATVVDGSQSERIPGL